MYKNKGFTLIEVMVVVIVVAVLVAMAVPFSRNIQSNSRLSSVVNTLASDLKKARSSSIVMRRNHTFSAIGSATGNVWGSGGWRVTQIENAVPQTMLQTIGLPSMITVSSTPNAFVFVSSTGMTQSTLGAVLNMTFTVCDSSLTSERGYNVLLNQFGRVLVLRHASSSICNT